MLSVYPLNAWGVYCKPCLQPISFFFANAKGPRCDPLRKMIIIKPLFQEGNTISTKLISLAALFIHVMEGSVPWSPRMAKIRFSHGVAHIISSPEPKARK